jgi:hypothetical protein
LLIPKLFQGGMSPQGKCCSSEWKPLCSAFLWVHRSVWVGSAQPLSVEVVGLGVTSPALVTKIKCRAYTSLEIT